MSIELTVLGLAKAVARRAAATWLGARRAAAERDLDLTELIRERVPGLLPARDVERLFDGIADAVMRRLQPMLAVEFSGLDEPERLAAVAAVVDTLAAAGIDDAALFGADAEPEALAAEVRRRVPDQPHRAALSEDATRLYALLLDECCDDYVRILITLPPFVARAQVEELGRLSRLEPRVAELLARLPARTLYAPAGAEHDDEFRREYLKLVLSDLDGFELYGADPGRTAQPKLSLGFMPLGLAADVARTTSEPRPEAAGAPRRGGMERLPQLARTLDTETALARSPRTFIRADAGAGKTTLLRWLAVTAARGGFTGALSGWNGLVPFMVRLRGLPKGPLPAPDALIHPTGTAISGHMPDAWIDRLFRDGRALLLVDGVDELPRERRAAVRDWLTGIVTAYPLLPVVVTSRPMAAGRGWLESAGFGGSVIPPMRPEHLRRFVTRWHQTMRVAVADADSGVRTSEELARRERALQQRLAAAPHLRSLATNPLLAALLCAINLERGSHLPRNRLELYQAALEMLLHRRDTERGIEGEVDLEYPEKLDLLADLAYRLTLYGYTELRSGDARRFVAERVAAMPRVSADPEAVFEHLLTRCGVLREPAVGRLDFVHRTFQEYLAARSLIAQSHLSLLIDRAHRDTWRETVIMAAGHAGETDRARLLGALLDRADTEKRHARKLRLLAVSCLETATVIPDEQVRDRMDAALARLMPPRDRDEARVFAALGPTVLRYLPERTEPLSAIQAEATVRVAALVGGDQAMRVLVRYNQDARYSVQESLLASWKYFDPGEYAQAVLADAAMEDVVVHAHESWRVMELNRLRQMSRLSIDRLDEFGFDITAYPKLVALYVRACSRGDLDGLKRAPWLSSLYVTMDDDIQDLSFLREMPALSCFDLTGVSTLPPLDTWELPEKLVILGANDLAGDVDASVLSRYSELVALKMSGSGVLRNAHHLADLPLVSLSLLEIRPDIDLGAFVRMVPKVEILRLEGCSWLDDVGPLAQLSQLRVLDLSRSEVPAGLDALAAADSLTGLWLDGCSVDLKSLRSIVRLKMLSLVGAAPGSDLSPLTEMRNLVIYLYEGQIATGVDRLGRGVRIKRVSAPDDYDPYAPVEP